MNLHAKPLFRRIPVKAAIPHSLGTGSHRINPWTPADQPTTTICRTAAGCEIKEAQIKPTCQSYRVLTGQEPKRHFGLVRLDPEKPCPTIQESSPQSSTTGLIHPYEIGHLTISEIKLMSSFPESFRMEGSFVEKWARIGNSVPPLLMRAIVHNLIPVHLSRNVTVIAKPDRKS
jgi:site-specific DNA-cytosine methylase